MKLPPSGSAVVTVTPVAASGPRLVTVIVLVKLLPATGSAGVIIADKDRSAEPTPKTDPSATSKSSKYTVNPGRQVGPWISNSIRSKGTPPGPEQTVTPSICMVSVCSETMIVNWCQALVRSIDVLDVPLNPNA